MRLPLLIFLFVWAVSLKAQVNLVPNPSFEEYEDCPVSLADFSVSNWFIPKYSPDYYNSCATSSQTGVPDNWGGGGYAHSGEAYAGIIVWVAEPYSNVREFFSVKLNESLIPGKKYNVEFYVSLMDSLWFATKNIGAYFSVDSIEEQTSTDFFFSKIPQIKYTGTDYLTEKEGWMKVEDSFYADGGEQFMTIGNYDDDEHIDTFFVGGLTGGIIFKEHSYYYIDDVSVTLDTTTGIAEIEKPKLKIFPNPAGNQITIEQLGVTDNQLSVEVYDALGRLVTLSVVEGQTSTIPLNLSKGVYLLRVKEKEEVVFWEKLIIE